MEKGILVFLCLLAVVVLTNLQGANGVAPKEEKLGLNEKLVVDAGDPEKRNKRCEDGCEDGPSASSKGAPITLPGVIKPPGKPKPPPASPRGGPPPASHKGGPPPASHKAPLSSRGGGGGGGSGISCQCDCDGLPLF